jgi:hypothetical protein
MLLACIDVLREFWRSTEDERKRFKPRLVEEQRKRISVIVFVEMHEDFEDSSGQKVERPWLRLKTLPDEQHLGLGMMKCRAICEVREDLCNWLRSVGAFIPQITRQIKLGE